MKLCSSQYKDQNVLVKILDVKSAKKAIVPMRATGSMLEWFTVYDTSIYPTYLDISTPYHTYTKL